MRTIARVLVTLLLVGVVGFFLLGYWTSGRITNRPSSAPVGTSGGIINTEKARQRGAEIGEKAAVATEKVRETVNEAAITAKIKAKMALDDNVKALAIDVTTSGTTVTLRGTVRSASERARAVALARETSGVTKVVDELTSAG
jgi:hypothetical protein